MVAKAAQRRIAGQASSTSKDSVNGTKPVVPRLYPGDKIEYCLTAEVKHRTKGTWWIKAGATTTIRESESVRQAKTRLRSFVHSELEAGVKDVLS